MTDSNEIEKKLGEIINSATLGEDGKFDAETYSSIRSLLNKCITEKIVPPADIRTVHDKKKLVDYCECGSAYFFQKAMAGEKGFQSMVGMYEKARRKYQAELVKKR